MAEERDRSGRQWTSEEMILALDTYLDGKGIAAAAAACGRSKDAVANVIRSDIPRNFRGCISWIKRRDVQKRRHVGWTTIELKYVVKLVKKGRSRAEIEIVIGRPYEQVERTLAEMSPKQTSPGFFPKEKS